jgi:hypothetical protein
LTTTHSNKKTSLIEVFFVYCALIYMYLCLLSDMKNHLYKIGLILVMSMIAVTTSVAQEEDIFGIERKIKGRKSDSDVGNVFRNVVSAFSLEVSSGAGYHTNQLNYFTSVPGAYPIESLGDLLAVEDQGTYKVGDYAFPVNVGLRLNMFGIFTLGGGYGREFGRISNFEMDSQQFQLEGTSYTYDKLYGTFGLVLYNAQRRAAYLTWKYRKYSSNNYYMQSQLKQRIRQEYPWQFVLEGEYGTIKIREAYDSHLSNTEPFYAVGLRVEREFSEYAKIYLKPSASFYKLSYDKTVNQNGVEIFESQPIKQVLYTLNVGLSISLPGTKRCKVAGCGVVMKHLHDGVEYRGSSIWKRQHRKVGQWYN